MADARAPDAAIRGTQRNRVAAELDAMIALRIDRIVRLGPARGDLAVAVGVDDARAPSLRGARVVRLVERRGVDPADGVVLAEDQVVALVEHVMVGGKAAVDHGELLRLRVHQFDLPRARAIHREVLRELVRRPLLAIGRLQLRRARACRDPHAPLGVHRHAAGIRLPLPDLFGPPVRRGRQVDVEHWRVRRNLDLARGVRARIEHRQDVGALVWPVDQPVRVHRWMALVGGGRIAAAAGWQPPVPHRDDEVAFDTDGTRRRFRIGARGDALGPVGERLALLAQTLEHVAHVRAVGSHRRVTVPRLEHRRQ